MKKTNVLSRVMAGLVAFGLVSVIVAIASPTTGYPPQSVTIGVASSQVAPSCNPISITTRATSTVYAINASVRVYSNGSTRLAQPLEYSCITTGATATTNLSNWGQTADITDGTVVWRPINQNRKAITIINDSTGIVYLAFGSTAVVGKGVRLNASGGSYTREGWRGAIYGISASASLNVCVQEE